MVRKDGFSDEDVVKLTSIATEQLKISAQNIKIVEVKGFICYNIHIIIYSEKFTEVALWMKKLRMFKMKTA